jgi:hypothetical protein
MLRRLALATAILMAVATPAGARELIPMAAHADNVGDRVVIQLQAPEHSWGIRKVARQINQEVPGLHIRRHGKCADRPELYCARVIVADFGRYETGGVSWIGEYSAPDGVDTIKLNASFRPRQGTACHELGHLLGLPHHNSRGCVGYPSGEYFSDLELSSMKAVYSTP